MEDVLELYSRPYNVNRPVVCMDEKSIQLLVDRRRRISMKKGKQEWQDSEYVRKDTCSIFLFTEPRKGWRAADAHEHRTRVDWANHIE